MDEMMKAISRYPNGTFLIVSWRFGKLIVEGFIDTIYEANNDLDEESEEYFACAFQIESVVQNSEDIDLKQGQLIEISKCNKPTSVRLKDGTTIWEC